MLFQRKCKLISMQQTVERRRPLRERRRFAERKLMETATGFVFSPATLGGREYVIHHATGANVPFKQEAESHVNRSMLLQNIFKLKNDMVDIFQSAGGFRGTGSNSMEHGMVLRSFSQRHLKLTIT